MKMAVPTISVAITSSQKRACRKERTISTPKAAPRGTGWSLGPAMMIPSCRYQGRFLWACGCEPPAAAPAGLTTPHSGAPADAAPGSFAASALPRLPAPGAAASSAWDCEASAASPLGWAACVCLLGSVKCSTTPTAPPTIPAMTQKGKPPAPVGPPFRMWVVSTRVKKAKEPGMVRHSRRRRYAPSCMTGTVSLRATVTGSSAMCMKPCQTGATTPTARFRRR